MSPRAGSVTRGYDRIAIAAFAAAQLGGIFDEDFDDALVLALGASDMQSRREFADEKGLALRIAGREIRNTQGSYSWLGG
jgi:hypothetical protein